MRITLAPGELIEIRFTGTDGAIAVAVVEEGAPSPFNVHGGGGIFVRADLPDSVGREGVIYHESLVKVRRPSEPEARESERAA